LVQFAKLTSVLNDKERLRIKFEISAFCEIPDEKLNEQNVSEAEWKTWKEEFGKTWEQELFIAMDRTQRVTEELGKDPRYILNFHLNKIIFSAS
jgi:hypothetical protein